MLRKRNLTRRARDALRTESARLHVARLVGHARVCARAPAFFRAGWYAGTTRQNRRRARVDHPPRPRAAPTQRSARDQTAPRRGAPFRVAAERARAALRGAPARPCIQCAARGAPSSSRARAALQVVARRDQADILYATTGARLYGIELCTFFPPPRTHAASLSVFARVAFPDCTARPAAPPTMAPCARVGASARGGISCWLGCVDYVYFAAPQTRPCT